MALALLDSDAVIDYTKVMTPAVTIIQDLHRRRDILCTCSVVLAEVYSGLAPEEGPEVERFLAGLLFLPAGPDVGRRAGMWRWTYARRGIALHTQDALIASTAYQHQAILVTGNVRDFPMPEIALLPLTR